LLEIETTFSPGETTMNARAIEKYRRRLLELVQRHSDGVTRQGDSLHGLGGESGGGLSNAPLHLADLGNAHHEEEVNMALMETEERLLAECNAALDRIDAGTFGLCQRCFEKVPPARLNAFPAASYCLSCSQIVEKEDAGFNVNPPVPDHD
jgi:RNA polymerase-binding transcription factor DksA